jgi:hypothetical protein
LSSKWRALLTQSRRELSPFFAVLTITAIDDETGLTLPSWEWGGTTIFGNFTID